MIEIKHLSVQRGKTPLRIAKGHFATNHSHINYYIDITYQKTRLSEAKAVAIADIAKMASDMEAEANVESLIMAKGFAQCVAVIGGDSINVVVDVDSTLNASQIAQINTIVFEQTGITPDKTVIIEK